jgi:hypothetical protein
MEQEKVIRQLLAEPPPVADTGAQWEARCPSR